MASRNQGHSQANGHSSRRDNLSISSNASSGSNRAERASSNRANPAVESAVTRLLVSIKALLESLTQWSQQRVDETHVSDVYVRLGNDFNAAVAAFAAFNIDMAELLSVPEDLRTVLEQCLAEEANAENLEIYLPEVRAIITHLLQGLRGKQSIYRRIVSDHKHRSGSGESGHDRISSRTSRREGSHRSHASRTIPEEERQEVVGSSSRRSGTGRNRRDVTSQSATVQNTDDHFVGGFAPTITEQPTATYSMPEPEPQRSSKQNQEPGPPQLTLSFAGSDASQTIPSDQAPAPPPPEQAPAAPVAPAHVKRYSLVDKPMSSPPPPPSVQIEPSSPDPASINGTLSPSSENIPLDPATPEVASSLEALKKNDVLQRRASKRFSTFNISKMTGATTTRERSLRGHPHRRSLVAANSAPTPTELAVLTEVDDEEPESTEKETSRPALPEPAKEAAPAAPAATTPSVVPEPTLLSAPSTQSTPSRITVFLQLGREVKKATIEPSLSFSSLRVLFVDKFSYNPGQENFPAIYIRDPSSGVQYELEDVEEVKDKCLLSLNIEPLDQIKQHIDSQISSLSQDIKDLKTAVANQPKYVPPIPDITAHAMAESTPRAVRPTDKQFQHVARRLSRFVGDPSISAMIMDQSSSPPMPVMPQMTGHSLQPQMTGASVMSEYSARVVEDLKTQFDEVQNLRRDLGIMRQMYTEFMKQTKETLGTLRSQTQSVKQLANTNIGGSRAYIESGKKKLDVRSQDVLTEVEKLQDTVERIKDDVIKRNTTPKPLFFKTVKKDIDATAAELESLKEHIKTIKPMWKKTWEEELQNIVEEQQFLVHQEEFLNDLIEDHKAVLEIYGHVDQIVSLRGPGTVVQGRVRQRTFRPPPPEEGHNGLQTVMLEIRGAAVDPEKRLKAIEENQRNREMERNAKTDELQAELQDFVEHKKLRMTGGAEEVERIRQKKNEMTLKAMFNPSTPTLSMADPTVNTESTSGSFT
ncbi:bud site selection protein 6 [Coprinopsis cinerea okayama7|uniref:Bud site selection protein 6 n=1 Tax=Coprinopsis cinerea (strain Okayama-7 / 130 / ATCC MYA-4618 / FGSC 9003) TaxID=240176 RepID=A8N958_COPC7|nr:bud site selection protein 6 [Coprinopsis cinerea okayama7\|eukprot:XP_001831386.2 bud site selection protein 6 [Coprinopsis cinerea okayama7\